MTTVEEVYLSHIIPGDNDRTVFDPGELEELATSIRQNGLAQPITIRTILAWDEAGNCIQCGEAGRCYCKHYQIVAGERRFRAVQLLGWPSIPAIVANLTEEEASAVMLAENTARANLDPIDQALAYQKRMARYGWSVQTVAEKAGVSPVHVQFRLKLLKLRQDIQALIRTGNLPIGYAQILADAGLDHNRQMIAFSRLRETASPTPGWFRRMVGALLEEQASVSLFDMSEYVTYALPIPDAPEPPHPTTTQPPAEGTTLAEIVAGQITFWEQAAEKWEQAGKPFKKQECQAAARALQALAPSLA